MRSRLTLTALLSVMPRARDRCAAWLANPRVRAGTTAAIVILVPGAGVAWLAWQVVRRLRPLAAPDA